MIDEITKVIETISINIREKNKYKALTAVAITAMICTTVLIALIIIF